MERMQLPAKACSDHVPEPVAARILVIDDNASVLETFRKILGASHRVASPTLDALEAALFPGHEADVAAHPSFAFDLTQSGEAGCAMVREAQRQRRAYALAFVDMRMPGDWDGLRTIEELWRIDPDLHVVMCSAYSDHSWHQVAARLGPSDRLVVLRKPFDAIEVLQLVWALSHKWHLERMQRSRVDELERRVEERTQHLEHALNTSRALERQLRHQGTHDMLTGLPNRNLLEDRIAQAIAQAERSGKRLAILFMDVDRFKLINDSFGHPVGDALLRMLADRFSATMRRADTVARLGGDEFVVVLRDLTQTDDVGMVALKLLHATAQPLEVPEVEPPPENCAFANAPEACPEPCKGCTRGLRVTASIGISVYPDDGADGATLLKHADTAMYRAKEAGGNGYLFFAREMSVRARERVSMEHALHAAQERRELALHYQPKVDLKSGRISGVEALVRWNRPGIGMVPPERFVPLAEEVGLIVPIGRWVLETACAQAAAWQRDGHARLTVAVNVSVRQFQQDNVPALVRAVLADTGLAPQCLELEITESVLMKHPETTAQALRELKAIGVTLSLDDFGTGYSSLSYLKRFPIDAVKIDRSFIADVTRNVDDAALTRAIIAMARSLDMATVAEGVETQGQLAFLGSNRCDAIQGYYFSPPLPADDMLALLRSGRQLQTDPRLPSDAPTLLLVDDEPGVLASLKRLMRRAGYRILTANGGLEALELLATHPVRVIVSDARMPGMSGVELLRRVKDLHPDAVRIMLSGYAELNAVTAAVNEGAVHKFLTKPWDDGDLQEHILQAFRRAEAIGAERDRTTQQG